MGSRYFTDLSSNNAVFSAMQYASAGHRLVAIKATEGETFIDPKHGERADRAHRANLLVAHYHFCRPDLHRTGEAEADLFWSQAKLHWRRGDYLVADIEVVPQGGMREAGAYLASFDHRLWHLSGVECVGYTFVSYLQGAGRNLQVVSKRWWMAGFGSRVPRLGHGRRRWAHQFTDGVHGPAPHAFAGVGQADGSYISALRRLGLERRWRRARRQGR